MAHKISSKDIQKSSYAKAGGNTPLKEGKIRPKLSAIGREEYGKE
jgi:hypothetical protein